MSVVREGFLPDLKEAITGLAEFIEENEPQLLSYNAYFSDDGTHMSVVHVHADPASLDRHLEIAGPSLSRFVTDESSDRVSVLGDETRPEVTRGANTQLRECARMSLEPLHPGGLSYRRRGALPFAGCLWNWRNTWEA